MQRDFFEILSCLLLLIKTTKTIFCLRGQKTFVYDSCNAASANLTFIACLYKFFFIPFIFALINHWMESRAIYWKSTHHRHIFAWMTWTAPGTPCAVYVNDYNTLHFFVIAIKLEFIPFEKKAAESSLI